MRHLGIDYGTRRVGVALSDAGGRFATPVQVLEITTPQQALEQVARVALSEGVEVLVLGIPLNMDGTEGPAASAVRRWGRELAETTKRPVVLVDERLSSFVAEQALVERKRAGERLSRKGKKRRLDAVAAAQLLQSYLDGKLAQLPE